MEERDLWCAVIDMAICDATYGFSDCQNPGGYRDYLINILDKQIEKYRNPKRFCDLHFRRWPSVHKIHLARQADGWFMGSGQDYKDVCDYADIDPVAARDHYLKRKKEFSRYINAVMKKNNECEQEIWDISSKRTRSQLICGIARLEAEMKLKKGIDNHDVRETYFNLLRRNGVLRTEGIQYLQGEVESVCA